MVKIFHLKKCGVFLEKVWSKWSRFANQKYDRESVAQSWSKWSRFSIWKSLGFAMRRYGPNGQDLQSVNLTDNSGTVMVQMVIICKAKIWQRICGTVMVKMVKIFHRKKYRVCLEKVWSKWSRMQTKNVTESLWDSHGQNGQDFPSEKLWDMAWD